MSAQHVPASNPLCASQRDRVSDYDAHLALHAAATRGTVAARRRAYQHPLWLQTILGLCIGLAFGTVVSACAYYVARFAAHLAGSM